MTNYFDRDAAREDHPDVADPGLQLDDLHAIAEGKASSPHGTDKPIQIDRTSGLIALGELGYVDDDSSFYTASKILDALEGCVRPVPAQTIDRDALIDLFIRYDVEHPATLGDAADVRSIYADRVLALLRPVDGEVQS